jgi:hypothetical protein
MLEESLLKADTNEKGDSTMGPGLYSEKTGGGGSTVNPACSRVFKAAVFLVTLFLFQAAPGDGQQPDVATAPLLVKVFQIQYKKVDDVYLLVSPLLSERGSIFVRPAQKSIRVRDIEPVILRVENVIRHFDQIPETVVIRFQLAKGLVEQPPAEVGAGQRQDFGDGQPVRPLESGAGDLPSVFPGDFGSWTKWKRFDKLGELQVRGIEGRKCKPVLFPGQPYRLQVVVGQVDKATGLVELERLTLEKKTLDKNGNIDYEPIINVAEIVYADRVRIFGATATQESRKAIFLAMQASID